MTSRERLLTVMSNAWLDCNIQAVLVLVGMGFVLKREASKSLDNYIVGGRHIP